MLPGRPAAVRPAGRQSGFWATTLTDVYATRGSQPGEARNMGLLAGGWTCSRCLGCLAVAWSSRGLRDDCGQAALHCRLLRYGALVLFTGGTWPPDPPQHGDGDGDVGWGRWGSTLPLAAQIRCLVVRSRQAGCHRQDRISRPDVACRVQARITSDGTLAGTTPCLAATALCPIASGIGHVLAEARF